MHSVFRLLSGENVGAGVGHDACDMPQAPFPKGGFMSVILRTTNGRPYSVIIDGVITKSKASVRLIRPVGAGATTARFVERSRSANLYRREGFLS